MVILENNEDYPVRREELTLPWITSPLIYSKSLSAAAGCQVYMKLDNFQPSGSFKSRGVGNLCLKAIQSRRPISTASALSPYSSTSSTRPSTPRLIRFYSSSGGNAGLAAVTAARSLGYDCTVVVPETTTQLMMNKIRKAGGRVLQVGESWAEADEYLKGLMEREMAQEGIEGVYCPPFDHPDIWEGNSTVIEEVLTQLPPGPAPAAIIASVGGGGLLAGLLLGLLHHRLPSIPILAVEPVGAASLYHALHSPPLSTTTTCSNTTTATATPSPTPAPFPHPIRTIATSLGASRIAKECYNLCKHPQTDIRCVVLDDADAARGCVKLAEEEGLMVEAACGISTAVCYAGLVKRFIPNLKKQDRVVVVICGGSNVDISMLYEYKKKYGTEFGQPVDMSKVTCTNGSAYKSPKSASSATSGIERVTNGSAPSCPVSV
ncbi:tryptophan synthase beta subunit-like PLP-dependent enzyme [Kalaharituber pfeilii]|nr:tryptophan synthase beta subunit-like PLP-dependent enzyme [Kalaharituber pfeilii]